MSPLNHSSSSADKPHSYRKAKVHRILAAVIAAAVLAVPAVADAKTCTSRTTGTCTKAGETYKIANRGQTLRLKSVAVKIVGKHVVTPTIGPFGDFGDSATAQGRYVVFVVKVTNVGNVPLDTILNLDFTLKLGRALYTPPFGPNTLIDDIGIIGGDEIQPGLSRTGTIAFDVARSRTALVRKNGLLAVDDDSDKRLGVIRMSR